MHTVADKLNALRAQLDQYSLDAWIAPTADPHLSEYLPEHWQSRVWLSGFTGSAGTLVITKTAAALWADSRYWEQAAVQLAGSEIELGKLGTGGNHVQWLLQHLPDGARVGIAGDMLSLAELRHVQAAFAARNITLHYADDIVAKIWHGRPALPQEPVFVHEAPFAPESAADKLARVRNVMREKGANHHLVSSLDDIAWITNLRGNDVPFNPVFLSFLLISADTAVLFADHSRFSAEAAAALQAAGIEARDYAEAAAALADVRGSLLVEPNKTAVSTLRHPPESVRLIEDINPSTLFKSVKSDADIARWRDVMAQDGAALCGFFAEFEQKLAAGERVTEFDIDGMLLKHRSRREGFISPSFGTIAGFNANAAMAHYSATAEHYSVIEGDGMLLIDSGGQYWGGTTDITRMAPVGTPSETQKRDYTLVLKAHIALDETVFPDNIAAPMIDAVCRKPLWQAQCNYGHGTGHGVGYFLNVHEGPQLIACAATPNKNHAMKKGMVTSIEPGLYRPGKWGIRIENLAANMPVPNPAETEFGEFLYFETLTLCPIDTRLMLPAMMDDNEIRWVNDYHAEVRRRLEPLTEGDAKAWLLERTKPLVRA